MPGVKVGRPVDTAIAIECFRQTLLPDFLERQGILECDEENSYLNLENADEDPMQQVLGCWSATASRIVKRQIWVDSGY